MNELRPANNVVSLYLYAWPSYSRFKGKLNMIGGGRLCFISKVVEFAKQRNRGPLAILCDLAFSFATSQFSRKREVPQLLWSAKPTTRMFLQIPIWWLVTIPICQFNKRAK